MMTAVAEKVERFALSEDGLTTLSRREYCQLIRAAYPDPGPDWSLMCSLAILPRYARCEYLPPRVTVACRGIINFFIEANIATWALTRAISRLNYARGTDLIAHVAHHCATVEQVGDWLRENLKVGRPRFK